jgi:hypothetical protein
MVQGLAFLSKKSWHTKNFANQEKVWLAEEQKRAEEQKTKELARQIQQEREEEELDKVAGTKKKRDRGIDWMYEGGNAQSELAKEDAKKQAEEYLLGKEFAATQPTGGHFNAEDKNEGIHAVLKQPPVSHEAKETVTNTETSMKEPATSIHLPSVHDRNESFRMRYEDPMFAVSQKAREKQEKLEQTKALYERVTGKSAVDRTDESETQRKSRKRSKKDKKRHKSHRKKEKKRRYDDSDSDSRSYRKRRRRSRSPSPRRDRSFSSARRQSDRGRERSRSWSEESSRGYSDYSPSPRYDDERYRNRESSRSLKKSNIHRSYSPDEGASLKKSGYGLIGSRDGTLQRNGPDTLGPDRELLDSKRQSREEERRRQRELASTRRHRTPEEREAALRAMEMDARHRGESRRDSTRAGGPDGWSDEIQEETRNHNPSFLHDVRRKANGLQGNSGLADRMRQNRNTVQRPDSDRFL